MGHQSPYSPYSGYSSLVDKSLGNAYPVVKYVHDNMDSIAYLAENAGAILEAGNAALNAVINQELIDSALVDATAAAASATAASESAAATLAIVQDVKSVYYPSVEDFRVTGYTDNQAVVAAANYSVASGMTVDIPYRATPYELTNNLNIAAKFSFSPGAAVSNLAFPAAPGTGGGYLAFEKTRLTEVSLLGQEQIEALAYTPGRNLLNNWCFGVWQRLDLLGTTYVTADSPIYGDADTYSGFGGKRVYGPDMWWGKMWSGAYDPSNPVTNPGGGQLKLERIPYISAGDIDSPSYMRATFTGFNPDNIYSDPPQVYVDPVNGPNTDVGTNSVEIGRTIRGARRYGKMTFKFRARWRSGDSSLVVRLGYNFGAGGSPAVSVNLQGFNLIEDGNVHDYVVHFNVPNLEYDGYGNPISLGTFGTDYITLSITSGDNGDFSYDVFAVGLFRGWGSFDWERYDYWADLASCRQEFSYVKVAYAGTTVSGSSFGGGVQYSMRSTPIIKVAGIDYNSGAFTGGVYSIAITSGGFNYTSPPTITMSGTATATCTISGGSVNAITFTPGGPYTSPPTITFSGGGGYGASAKASLMATPFAIDKYGAQWWMLAGSTGNNARISVRLSCDAQVVKG